MNETLPKKIRHKQETLAQGKDFKRWRLWACYEGPNATKNAINEIQLLREKRVKAKRWAPLPRHNSPYHIHIVILATFKEFCELAGIEGPAKIREIVEPCIDISGERIDQKKPLNIVCRIRKEYLYMIDKGFKEIEFRPDTKFWRTRIRNLIKGSANFNPPNLDMINSNGLLVKFYEKDFKAPVQIVLVSGKTVRRRHVTYIERIENPIYSEQGKKDVPTPLCWAIKLGVSVEGPK